MYFLSIRDLVAILGVSEETLWRWRTSGKFPPPTINSGGHNGYRRWKVSVVAQWLNISEEELIQMVRAIRQQKSAGACDTGTVEKV